MSTKEKVIYTFVAIINMIIVTAGVYSCYDPHLINKYNSLVFAFDSLRKAITKYVPMLFFDVENGIRVPKILGLVGGSTQNRSSEYLYMDNSISIEMNTFAKIVKTAPMIGKSLLVFLGKLSIIAALVGNTALISKADVNIDKWSFRNWLEIK